MGGGRVGSAFELGCESKNVNIARSQARSQFWAELLQEQGALGFAASFPLCSQLQACVSLLPLVTSFQLCPGCWMQSEGPQTTPVSSAGAKL